MQKELNWTPLWPTKAPGGKVPPTGTEQFRDGHLYQIERPEYDLHLASKPNGAGIILFPGGGYRLIALNNEGETMARFLNELGFSVMIAKYRIDHENIYDYQFPAPLLDARRAIRTMRHNSEAWGINKNEIGIMGFSAGGHLAGMASTLFTENFAEETNDAIDHESPRPDFSILCYPVIDMSHDFKHAGSAEHLTRGIPTLEQKLSLQHQVSEQTPPTLIFHSADDEPVPVKNSFVYAEACIAKKVPTTMHIFSGGGHGYSLTDEGDHSHWPELLKQWLELKQWQRDAHSQT
ncbi:alpha/beta hydrolase [Puniceicoccaceae bacterium K14]|nr:alpha/beta hydrolase [Puniceicoccaceae bacterium K14]